MAIDFGTLEAAIYLKCLQYENGLQVSEIADYIEKDPSLVSKTIENLVSQRIIKSVGDRYIATPIEEVAELFKNISPGIFAILPLLSGTKYSGEGNFNIRLFNGADGIRQIHDDIIDTVKDFPDGKKCIYQIASSDDLFSIVPNHQESFINKRVEHEILLYWMAPKTEENFKHALRTDENIRIAKFFDGNIFPFNIEFDVYGEKVAIITLNENKLCGVVIEIPSVVESMKSICELLWKLL